MQNNGSGNRAALLIIDVQVAPFIWKDYGGPELWDGDGLISRISALADRARQAGVPVIYMQHTEAEGTPRGAGMPLWEIHPGLQPLPSDYTLNKFQGDALMEGALRELLARLGVTELLVAGVQTEYCVDTVCRSAHALGYRTTLVRDGHTTFDAGGLTAAQITEHHNRLLEQGGFAAVLPASEIAFEPTPAV